MVILYKDPDGDTVLDHTSVTQTLPATTGGHLLSYQEHEIAELRQEVADLEKRLAEVN